MERAALPPHAMEMIERLIAFPTISADSNMALIDYVRTYLKELGCDSTLVPNKDGTKANLYATIGPNVAGGVVLSGHTDVVPVKGQDWTTSPWLATIKGDKLYGRGVADMKSYCALALAILPDFLAQNPSKPLHLAFSYDEEVGCIGAPDMIEKMVGDVPSPRAVIVGEPTSMKVVTAHKSILGVETKVRGHTVHSCQVHQGVSATMTAARLVTFLEDLMEENKAASNPKSAFTPPYSTIHCGVIEGGTASNIVAKDCRILTDIRTIAGEDPLSYLERYKAHIKTNVLPKMQAIAPDTSIQIHPRKPVPALAPEINGAAEQLGRQLTGDKDTTFVSYATEAGQFQTAGYSTIVCGPGSIDQAHKADEFISLDQLGQGWQFMQTLARTVATA